MLLNDCIIENIDCGQCEHWNASSMDCELIENRDDIEKQIIELYR